MAVAICEVQQMLINKRRLNGCWRREKIWKKEHKKKHKEFQVCFYFRDVNRECVRHLMQKPFPLSTMWILIVDENVDLDAQK